jgi:HipA-like protein
MGQVGKVFYGETLAGHIERREEYNSPVLFPFFSGLLAEGNLKDLQCRLYRIDPNDDFTRLLKTTRYDLIGAVTVEEVVS